MRSFFSACLALVVVGLASFVHANENQLPAQHYENPTVYNGDVHITNQSPDSNGHAMTWQDPENGDIVTSVRAPRRQQQTGNSTPIVIIPRVYPDGWNNYSVQMNGMSGHDWHTGRHQLPATPLFPAKPSNVGRH